MKEKISSVQSSAWWCLPIISTLGRLRHEDCKLRQRLAWTRERGRGERERETLKFFVIYPPWSRFRCIHLSPLIAPLAVTKI